MSYRIGRPIQEVRLRNWHPGEAAQIKTAIAHLEAELNVGMGMTTEQTERRVLSVRVPIMTDSIWSVTAGFKAFSVIHSVPKGIEDLLFFELEHDTNSGFANPTTIRTVAENFVVAGNLSETRHFRVRVVNSRFETAAWSATESGTTARGRISTHELGQDTAVIDVGGAYTTVMTKEYTSSGGKIATNWICGVTQVGTSTTYSNSMNLQVRVDTVEQGVGRIVMVSGNDAAPENVYRGGTGITSPFFQGVVGVTYTIDLRMRYVDKNSPGAGTGYVAAAQIMEVIE